MIWCEWKKRCIENALGSMCLRVTQTEWKSEKNGAHRMGKDEKEAEKPKCSLYP